MIVSPDQYKALEKFYRRPTVRLYLWWKGRHNRRWRKRFFKRYP